MHSCGQRCNINSRCYRLGPTNPPTIPARYVTHCALSVNGNTQVLLAMSKLDGVPLDQWRLGCEGGPGGWAPKTLRLSWGQRPTALRLYGINEHELKVISREPQVGRMENIMGIKLSLGNAGDRCGMIWGKVTIPTCNMATIQVRNLW